MQPIAVNISVNKTFATYADDLLTRNPQHVHELYTELFTLSNQFIAKAKPLTLKKDIREQATALHSALAEGWIAAVKMQECPRRTRLEEETPTKVRYLVGPYRALGYTLGMRVHEMIIARGHHRTQGASATQENSTQDLPPRDAL